MKKVLTVLSMICITLGVSAQAGRVRVTFFGFECFRETWDDILNTDGKGDEVYLSFGVSKANSSGTVIQRSDKRTKVYGDATGQFSNRIPAGSCVDLLGNNKGGIRAGDSYRGNEMVGEYDLANGEFLVVAPTAWEHDPIADNYNSFSSTMNSLFVSVNQKLAPVMMGLNALHGNFAGVIFNAASLGLPKVRAGGEQGELGRAGTRPIGMEKYGDFNAQFVSLNNRTIQEFTSTDAGYGRGVVAINYDENAIGNARDHGNYTILLKIEWFPSQVVPPAPAPSGNNANVPPPPAPVRTNNAPPPATQNNVPPPPRTTTAPPPPPRTTTAPPPPSGTTTAPPVASNNGGSTVPPPAVSAAGGKITTIPVRPVRIQVVNTVPVKRPPVEVNNPAATLTPMIAGHYEGTQWNDEGLYPQHAQFDLTDKGEFFIRISGAVAASGTYTITGNKFNAFFRQHSSNETFTYAGSYEGGQLRFTAGAGRNTSGQGRFVMDKK